MPALGSDLVFQGIGPFLPERSFPATACGAWLANAGRYLVALRGAARCQLHQFPAWP
jgi:hypothetical protein